ncbi:hypothetical protein CRG98_018457 [Punica granatum]|uniref:Uncharacterized protein n=1 Tax=Punica granatum TaxID=22663 RepID=A0A2I0JXS9_PUNGR|nr:hypothetical protein CRG98_018457 [Punica granatum]
MQAAEEEEHKEGKKGEWSCKDQGKQLISAEQRRRPTQTKELRVREGKSGVGGLAGMKSQRMTRRRRRRRRRRRSDDRSDGE